MAVRKKSTQGPDDFLTMANCLTRRLAQYPGKWQARMMVPLRRIESRCEYQKYARKQQYIAVQIPARVKFYSKVSVTQ